MDSNLQLKYLALRNKLSDHRYTGYLGIESVELAEKMFADINALTSSYNELIEKDKRSSNDLTLAQSQLFPLRKENARLARENHQLHIDAVKLSNANDGIISEQTLVTNRYKDELAEVKLLLKMRDDQLNRKDQDMSRLRDAYEALTGLSSAQKSLMSTKRILKMTTPLKPSNASGSSNSNNNNNNSINNDENIMDGMTSKAERELINTLRGQLDIANNALATSNAEISRIKAVLNSREQELIRITKTKLESISESSSSTNANAKQEGSSLSSSSMMGRIDQLAMVDTSNKRIIDQLNSQVDFLNEQLAFRENDILYAKQELSKHDALKLEHQHIVGLLDMAREEKSDMMNHIRDLERRLEDYSVAVDSFDNSSVGNSSIGASSIASTARSGVRSVTSSRGINNVSSSKQTTSKPSSTRARSTSRDRTATGGSTSQVAHPKSSNSNDRNAVSSNSISSNSSGSITQYHSHHNTITTHGPRFSSDSVRSTHSTRSNAPPSLNATQSTSVSAGDHVFGFSNSNNTGDVTSSNLSTPVASHQSADFSLLSDAGNSNSNKRSPPSNSSNNVLTTKTEFILNERVKRAEAALKSLKEELKAKDDEFVELQRKYTIFEAQVSSLEEVNGKYKDNIEKFRNKLTEESTDKDVLSRKFNELDKNYKIVSMEKETLSMQVETLRKDLSSLRQKHSEVSIEYSKQGQNSLEADNIKKSQSEIVEKLYDELKVLQVEKSKLEIVFEEASIECENLKKKDASRQQLYNELQSKYNDKCKELTELLKQSAMLQQQLHSKDDMQSAEEHLKSRIAKLLGDKSSLEVAVEKLQAENFQIRHEKELVEIAVSKKINENTHELNRQELNHLEKEIEKKNNFVFDLERKNHSLDSEKSKLTSQVAAMQLSITSLQTRLDDYERVLKTKDNELSQMRSDNKLTESRYREKELLQTGKEDENKHLLKELHRNSEKTSRLEKDLEELRESLSFVQSDRDRLDDETLDLKRKLDILNRKFVSENSENRQLADDSEQWREKCLELKELLRNMEGQSKLHAHKMNKIAIEKDDEIEKSKKLIIDNDLLRTKVRELEKNLHGSSETLNMLDEERDKLQAQLDECVELLTAKSKEKGHLEVQLVQVRQIVDKMESKITFLNNDSVTKQRQIGVLESRLASIHDENQEIHRSHSMKVNELKNASGDLILMTRENQALTSELSSMAQERDSLHHKITEFVAIIGNLENEKRSLELERSDLIETYRNNLQEKKKIESDLIKVSEMKVKAGHSIQGFHSQLAEMKGVITSKENNESLLMSEKMSLRSQLQKINDELVKKQREIETFESENKRLIQDTYGLRQANSMLNERLQFLMKRIESLTDSNKVINNKLVILENERESLARLITLERQKSTEMGQVIQVVRGQMADKDIQLQRAKIELSALPSGYSQNEVHASGGKAGANDISSLGRSSDEE